MPPWATQSPSRSQLQAQTGYQVELATNSSRLGKCVLCARPVALSYVSPFPRLGCPCACRFRYFL